MDGMRAFRRQVFVDRLGWALPMLNGVEQDQYDRADTNYAVQCDDTARVTACARLLPTTGAYMLPQLFPQLLAGREPPNDRRVWELSRFAINVRATSKGRVLALSQATLDFLDLILDFAAKKNVMRLLLVTSVAIERLMLRAAVPVHRIGPPASIDRAVHVALFVEVAPGARAPEPRADRHERFPGNVPPRHARLGHSPPCVP
jgi:N-acyl-L-homoserine lactone synthetase